ncbi:hypothetical protein JHK87_018582 [Glycine soja]|nr:hypothetical protein JHK87_018582 [Glycine soja]
MPCLNLSTNVNLDGIDTSSILSEATSTVASIIGKPEAYVMIVLKGSVPISHGGSEQPAAYGELVSIGGLSPDVNKKLSAGIASILENKLSVPKSRFYLKFYDTKAIKDLSKITLAKLVSAMQSQEQRRLMRQDGAVEGALPAKHHHAESSRKKYVKKNQPTSSENSANNQNKGKGKKKNYPPCQHCGKLGHPPYKCWKRPDAKCSKCNRLGHEAIICRSKVQQHEADAQVVARGRRLYFYCNVLFDEE